MFDSHCHLDYLVLKFNKSRTRKSRWQWESNIHPGLTVDGEGIVVGYFCNLRVIYIQVAWTPLMLIILSGNVRKKQ